MLKTDQLDKCLEILNFWYYPDNNLGDILANLHTNLFTAYSKPFSRELGENLLTVKSKQKKTDIIKFYLQQVDRAGYIPEAISCFKPDTSKEAHEFETVVNYAIRTDRKENPDESDDLIGIKKFRETGNGDGYSIACMIRHQFLRISMFAQIEENCKLYDIPFIELCKSIVGPASIICIPALQFPDVLPGEIASPSPVPVKQTADAHIQPSSDELLSKIKASENLFIKGIPMEIVISHFVGLTTRKSRNGKPFLTQEQLVSFLQRGFLKDDTQDKQTINCRIGEKGFLIRKFYDFYELAVTQYNYPAKKEKYINLFTDCFNNWPQHTVKLFFMPGKTKEKWE